MAIAKFVQQRLFVGQVLVDGSGEMAVLCVRPWDISGTPVLTGALVSVSVAEGRSRRGDPYHLVRHIDFANSALRGAPTIDPALTAPDEQQLVHAAVQQNSSCGVEGGADIGAGEQTSPVFMTLSRA